MTIQSGGLKLKNPSKTGFTPIFDMINSSSSNLSLLTYKSLKGFMITLDVSKDDSEYLGLNSKYRFETPVTSFILKFAVTASRNDTRLPIYNGINKSSESMDSYYEEATLQQTIWINSISGGRPEMCPPVANFSLFNNHDAISLCQFFQSKTAGDAKDIFDYLYNLMGTNVDYGIGVIVMPKVENSTTFGDLIYAPSARVSKQIKGEAYASVSAKIARLFVEIGVIHFDLHSGNALVYFKPDNTVGSLIIDFGRASNIMNFKDDGYLTRAEKGQIIQIKNQYYDKILSMSDTAPDNNKKKYMLSVLKYIADIDYDKNQKLFRLPTGSYQMDWFEDYPTEIVPVKAFNILKQSITIEGLKLTRSTITTYLSKGFILNLDRDIDTFIVNFPGNPPATASIGQPPASASIAQPPASASIGQPPASASIGQQQPPCDEEVPGMCVISGGKRRRRTRKNRKHKKTRKYRKSRRTK
jgi:hypothetical protein